MKIVLRISLHGMEERRRWVSLWISRVILSDDIFSFSISSSFTGVSSIISFDDELLIDVFNTNEVFFIGVFSTLANDELEQKIKIQKIDFGCFD